MSLHHISFRFPVVPVIGVGTSTLCVTVCLSRLASSVLARVSCEGMQTVCSAVYRGLCVGYRTSSHNKVYKALPINEWCPSLVDYLTDYYGGPSKVAELTGRTLYFHRKSYDKDAPDYNVLKYTQLQTEKRHAKKKEAQAAFVAGVKPVCIISPNAVANGSLPLDVTPDTLEKNLRASIDVGRRNAGSTDVTTCERALQQLGATSYVGSSDAAPREIVFIQVGLGSKTCANDIRKMHSTVGTKCEKIVIDQSSQVAAAKKSETGVSQRKRLETAVQHGYFDSTVEDFDTAMESKVGSRAVIEMAREILARGPETLCANVGETEGRTDRGCFRGAAYWGKSKNTKEWPATWSHQLTDGQKMDVKKVSYPVLRPGHVVAQGGGAASSSVAGAPAWPVAMNEGMLSPDPLGIPQDGPVAMNEGMLSPDPLGIPQDDPMDDSAAPDKSDALKTAPPQLKRWWNTQFGEELTVAKWQEWRKKMAELLEVVHDSEDLQEQDWYVL